MQEVIVWGWERDEELTDLCVLSLRQSCVRCRKKYLDSDILGVNHSIREQLLAVYVRTNGGPLIQVGETVWTIAEAHRVLGFQ